MKLTVIGCGYLGATHAACMAELGHEVLGVDVDEAKIATLVAGDLPFYEPGLVEVLRRNIDNGRLRFTTDYTEIADWVHGTGELPLSLSLQPRSLEDVFLELSGRQIR